jgi:peroxiredoxin
MSVRPVAISVDSPKDSSDLCRKAGITYTVLSDGSRDTIRHYDLLISVDGQNVAGAAEFLVDSSGIVRWRKLSEARPAVFTEAAAKYLR